MMLECRFLHSAYHISSAVEVVFGAGSVAEELNLQFHVFGLSGVSSCTLGLLGTGFEDTSGQEACGYPDGNVPQHR